MNKVRLAFLSTVVVMSWGVSAKAGDAASSTVLVDMFRWWNGIINSEEVLTADQFRQYFTDDAVILVNNQEQVRGVEHMPEHFRVIRDRPGSIEIELPFREEFQSGNKIFTYHAIRSVNGDVVNTTYNMGYAVLEDGKISSVSLARFAEPKPAEQ